jgi:hypothetical protein
MGLTSAARRRRATHDVNLGKRGSSRFLPLLGVTKEHFLANRRYSGDPAVTPSGALGGAFVNERVAINR